MAHSARTRRDEPTVVAVINSSPDTVEMLRQALQPTGILVVGAMTFDIRDGRIDLASFLAQHQPKAIVYDIAPPYHANWALFEHLRQVDGAKRLPFVVTSTNVKVVRELAGNDRHIYEIVGKPYDLGLIVDAVKHAVAERLL